MEGCSGNLELPARPDRTGEIGDSCNRDVGVTDRDSIDTVAKEESGRTKRGSDKDWKYEGEGGQHGSGAIYQRPEDEGREK